MPTFADTVRYWGKDFWLLYHEDTCECPSPRLPLVRTLGLTRGEDDRRMGLKRVTSICAFCGLTIRSRKEKA